MAGCLVPLSRWFYQGQVAPGAKINVYGSLGTTPQTVYADGDLSTPTTNPVVCDSNGEAVFYVADSQPLRLYVTTSSGTLIRDIDPVYPIPGDYLSGVTPGTAQADKVVVLGTGRTLDYLDVAALKGNGVPFLSPPGGRLTLTSNTPVTTADVTAATTIYYTPFNGAAVPVFSGGQWKHVLLSQDSLALDSDSGHTGYHQSGKLFDVFAELTSTNTLRIGTGPAWTSDTARGTGAGTTELQQLNGIWTNRNEITLRHGSSAGNTSTVSANQATYLGTIRCTANGQTEDSLVKRLVWNAYNREHRPLARFDTTDSWNYSTAAWRQANGSTANQLEFVIGLSTSCVEALASSTTLNSTATLRSVSTGIGLDSLTAPSTNCILGRNNANNTEVAAGRAACREYPGIGYHYLAWLEYGGGADTQTWYGDAGEAITKNGIIGSVLA